MHMQNRELLRNGLLFILINLFSHIETGHNYLRGRLLRNGFYINNYS